MGGPTVLLGLGCNLLIGSLISAVILRAACSLWNKWFGNKQPVAAGYSAVPPTTESFGDESNPFSARDMGVPERMVAVDGIMEPEFGYAYVTCFLASFVNLAISFVARMLIGAMAGDSPPVVLTLQLALLPIVFLITSAVYMARLETTFPRAMAVTGLTMLIGLAVGAVIVAVVVGVMMVTGFASAV